MATEKLNEGLTPLGEILGGTEIFLPFPTCLSLSPPTFLLQIVSAKDSERRTPASAAVTKNTFQVSHSLFTAQKTGFSFSHFIV